MSEQGGNSRPRPRGRPVMPPELRVSDHAGQSPMARAAAILPRKPYRWGGISGPVIGRPGSTAAQRELAEEGDGE